ncbi:HNH endonuclease signature motif containing protein [Ilumatobacter coccineus]|uniref:HNH nuclease domain-containing protein n=1 Tax=Ilumatobacter coccineus (strain NBRC 103263 / KCTC 29153 / YM16-304) TaxID=1313172 RepID=A0A6C7EB65_ILUCY|nr:HNH endonuclease signature motif containing protein [Ilumatobacter coccineus]BAN03242.1 hypothetical protein YM304_29280 [Ilumatobacter coccineus YM16-304]
MSSAVIGKRVANVAAVLADAHAEREQVATALVDVRSIRAWADAHEARLVAQLSRVDSFPEATIADTNRCSVGAATKTKERSDTLAATPTLADSLAEGAITAGHVDAVTRGSKRLDDDEQRAEFLDRADQLAGVAEHGTIEQFGKRLDLEIKKLQSDDGEERLTRQKKNTRLSTWVDLDGMWNIRGRFDPVTGLRLANKIDAATQALFAKQTPEYCPTDGVEKNKFLAAHALAHLIERGGGAAATGRPEFVAVIDADAPPAPSSSSSASGPAVEFNIPVELPARILADLAATADVVGVVVRNGVVLHAPGNLNLGRSTRLANRAQRRALRALYATCAVHGCTTNYDRCKLHHVVWWRNGGRTDLDNLLPVCSKHHAKIHNSDWVVELGPNRELTLTLPDGQIMNTGPPRRNAA